MPRRLPHPGSRFRLVVTVAVVVAVASPALRQRDSYPLSTYPVYATARPGQAVLHTAVGVAADGTRRRLSPVVIGDSDDPLIVEDRVADAVAAGRADRLCTTIAGRAAPDRAPVGSRPGSSGGRGDGVVAVEVVSERVDLVATAADAAPPLTRTVHATCPVPP